MAGNSNRAFFLKHPVLFSGGLSGGLKNVTEKIAMQRKRFFVALGPLGGPGPWCHGTIGTTYNLGRSAPDRLIPRHVALHLDTSCQHWTSGAIFTPRKTRNSSKNVLKDMYVRVNHTNTKHQMSAHWTDGRMFLLRRKSLRVWACVILFYSEVSRQNRKQGFCSKAHKEVQHFGAD